jgi:ubiquinone/menaquinone biosynthesis C-methylase UbiE
VDPKRWSPTTLDNLPPDPRYTIFSYDYCTNGNPLITEADIANVPLNDGDVDIVLICMALWGSNNNQVQCITEARRIINSGGCVYIIDHVDRADDIQECIHCAGLKILIKNMTPTGCYFECSNP